MLIPRSRRYIRVMAWMLRHSLLRMHRMTATVGVLSIIYLAMQAVTVGALYVYVRLVEGKQSIAWLPDFAALSSSHLGLVTMILVFVGCLGLSHLAMFRVRTLAIDACGDQEIYCGRVALSLASLLPDLTKPLANRMAAGDGLRNFLIQKTRYCGLMVRLLVLAIPSVVALGASTIAMLLIDPWMTLIVVAAGGPMFLLQYPANVRGASATRVWHRTRAQAILATTDTIRKQRENSEPLSLDSPLVAHHFAGGPVIETIRAYVERLRAIELGTLATQLGTIVVIGIIVFLIGDRALGGKVNWAVLVAYVSVLRLAAAHYIGIARTTTGMARLYPYVQEFAQFVEAAQADAGRDAEAFRGNWFLRLTCASNDGEARVRLDPGTRLALVAAAAGVAGTDLALAAAITVHQSATAGGPLQRPGAGAGTIAWIRKAPLSHGNALGEAPAFPAEFGAERTHQVLSSLGVDAPHLLEAQSCEKTRDAGGVESGAPCRPENACMVRLQAAAAILKGAAVVMIERDALDAAAAADDPLLDTLSDGRVVVLLQSSANMPLDKGEIGAIVIDSTPKVVAWVERRADMALDEFRAAVGDALARTRALAVDEEEDVADDLDA